MKSSNLLDRGSIALALLCAGFVGLTFLRGGGTGTCALLAPPSTSNPIASADALTNWALPDLEGRIHSPDDGASAVKVVTFWASWCGNCRREMPTLVSLQEELGPRGLEVLAIRLEDAPVEDAAAYARSQGLNFPVLVPSGEALNALRQSIRAVPTTLVLAADGTVITHSVGALTARELRTLVAPYLPAEA